MKWPRSLKLNGYRIKVRLVSRKDLKKRWGVEVLGDYDSGSNTIRIWRGLDERGRWQTLLHEILHACWNESGGVKEETLEEKILERVEGPLYNLLHENFKFGG